MKTITFRNIRSLLAFSVMAMLLLACGRSGQDGDRDVASDATAAKVPITTSSDEARALYMQGRALSEDLLIVDANDVFQQVVAADDSFAMGHYMVAVTAQTNAEFFAALGRASDRASNASDGEQLTIKALAAGSDNDQAAQRDALEQLIAAYPKDERAHVQMANFLFGQEDFEGAVAHYGHAIAIAPSFASAYNSSGYAHRSLEDFAGARAMFEKYVELIPHQANPHDSLAELLMEMGDYDESIANYRESLKINPYFAASYAGITINHSLKGEPERAQEVAEDMLAAARNFAERQGAMFQSVSAHLFAGNLDEAMKVCDVMMAEAGVAANHSAMAGVAEYMGDIMMASGDAAKAEEYFDAALDHRLQANLSEANKAQASRTHLFKTAIASMIGGDTEAAAARTAEYNAVAEADGTLFEKLRVHELSGYLAMNQDDEEKAAKHFDKASKLQPIPLYWAARVNKDLGNLDKARDLAKRAATRNTLNPNLPLFRADAVALLAELSTDES